MTGELMSRDRVVCVLTTGQAWQFKPYKWQDAKILFRHGELAEAISQSCRAHIVVKGVYFQWNNEPTNPAVKDWNIAEMRVSDRTRRDSDALEYWLIYRLIETNVILTVKSSQSSGDS